MKHITIVLGTARNGCKSERVAQMLVHRCNQTDGVTAELVRVADHVHEPATIPPWGAGGVNEVSSAWKEIVQKTDAMVHILPEYNHSYPGEWKLLMDTLFTEYAEKATYVVGVSGGSFGGTRVVEHVMPVLVNFKVDVRPNRLHVTNVADSVSEDGTVHDAALRERAEQFVDAIMSDTE